MVLGHHRAGEVDLAAGDMAVDVDAAGHDDLAREVEALIDADIGPGRCGDAAVADMEIRHLAAPFVAGVEDAPAAELDAELMRSPLPERRSPGRCSCRVAPALGRGEGLSALSGRATTPSVRKIWPA